ncbi:hypothetical protein FV219_14105, partial [Methylobacterium sp. WL122]
MRLCTLRQGRHAAPPPPFAGEGGPRAKSGEGSDVSGYGAPLSRPSLTRGSPSPAEGGGKRPAAFDDRPLRAAAATLA